MFISANYLCTMISKWHESEVLLPPNIYHHRCLLCTLPLPLPLLTHQPHTSLSFQHRKQTDAYQLKLQQRKDLYEDMYQDIREGCEQTASVEVLEALQREAQLVRAPFVDMFFFLRFY